MRKFAPFVVFVAVFAAWQGYKGRQSDPDASPTSSAPTTRSTSASPYASPPTSELRAGQQVELEGTVVRVLSDDTSGSRHQRFIVRLRSGQTVLIAHNIDIAPRVDGIAAGDSVRFAGEFEENDKGGVVHWTHHDPSGRHPDGFIVHQGHTYR